MVLPPCLLPLCPAGFSWFNGRGTRSGYIRAAPPSTRSYYCPDTKNSFSSSLLVVGFPSAWKNAAPHSLGAFPTRADKNERPRSSSSRASCTPALRSTIRWIAVVERAVIARGWLPHGRVSTLSALIYRLACTVVLSRCFRSPFADDARDRRNLQRWYSVESRRDRLLFRSCWVTHGWVTCELMHKHKITFPSVR